MGTTRNYNGSYHKSHAFGKYRSKTFNRNKKICELLPDGVISVQITEQDPHRAYEQALRIADIAQCVVVKFPVIKNIILLLSN